MTYETEAVLLELRKTSSTVECRLKPTAGTTAVEINGVKYVAGQSVLKKAPKKGTARCAKLWPLNSNGVTEAKFEIEPSLEQWALLAWEKQRKVLVVLDDTSDRVTEITLP